MPRVEPSALQSLREYLLPPTLEFAATNVPYYRERWGAAWRGIRDVAGLARLPLLTKAEAIAVQEGLLSGVEPLPTPVLSSGTLRDGRAVLEVRRSAAELEAQRSFMALLARRDEGPPAEPGRLLVVVNTHHGLPLVGPGPDQIHVPFGPHHNSLVQIQRLLEREFALGERVNAMVLSVSNLKVLTLWLLEQGLDPARYAVRDIGTNSSLLSQPWRAQLERLWNARLWDNYSLSELPTVATECAACGHCHFDSVPVVPELIDPFKHTPLARGPGLLVLSGLYPYQQAMPLLRYVTGDLVATDDSCPSGERGYRALGRLDECVLEAGSPPRLLLAPRTVLDGLDGLPDVVRSPQLFEQLGLIAPGSCGRPRVHSSARFHRGRCVGLEVAIELRYPPALYRERSHAVTGLLRRALLQASPELARRVERGRCELQVLARPPAPGARTPALAAEDGSGPLLAVQHKL